MYFIMVLLQNMYSCMHKTRSKRLYTSACSENNISTKCAILINMQICVKQVNKLFKGHVSHIMPILMTFFLFSFQTVLFCCLYLLSVLKKIITIQNIIFVKDSLLNEGNISFNRIFQQSTTTHEQNAGSATNWNQLQKHLNKL